MTAFGDYCNALQRRSQEAQEYHAMVKAGWHPYSPDASEEEKVAALAALGRGRRVEWYPLGYMEEPIITEGKLHVADDLDEAEEYEPVAPRRKWFGLF